MTKRFATLTTAAILLANVFLSFAPVTISAAGNDIDLQINKPDAGIDPSARPGQVISNVITIVFVVAALVVLFFLILGAFQWITSGGDKDKVGKARQGILNALIGLAVLAL